MSEYRPGRSQLRAIAGVLWFGACVWGCGGRTERATGGSGASTSSAGGSGTGGSGGFGPGIGLSSTASTVVVAPPCDATSNVCTCTNGTTSGVSIKGTVYDPAGVNPVYNAWVYVIEPSTTLPDLDAIPIACATSPLFPPTVRAYATTDGSGSFQIPCPPTGSQSLVVQLGKWRMRFDG